MHWVVRILPLILEVTLIHFSATMAKERFDALAQYKMRLVNLPYNSGKRCDASQTNRSAYRTDRQILDL